MDIKKAYKNLYTSDIKSIDKNLENLIKAKKIISQKNKTQLQENEMEQT